MIRIDSIPLFPSNFDHIDEGIYKLRLTDIKESIGKYENKIFIFTFAITEHELYNDIQLQSWMGKASHPKSKLMTICKALYGGDFNPKSTKRSDLITKECYGEVKLEGDRRKLVRFISVQEYEKRQD